MSSPDFRTPRNFDGVKPRVPRRTVMSAAPLRMTRGLRSREGERGVSQSRCPLPPAVSEQLQQVNAPYLVAGADAWDGWSAAGPLWLLARHDDVSHLPEGHDEGIRVRDGLVDVHQPRKIRQH